MKKNLLFTMGLTAALCTSVNAQMQPPNGGFETWDVLGSGAEDPTEWSSLNEYAVLGLPEMCYKTLDANSGTYALRVISDTASIPPPFGTGGLDTIGGIVSLGDFGFDTPGIPYTDRPILLEAFIKGTVVPSDLCFIFAELSKWNSSTNERDEVGTAFYIMSASVSGYTQISSAFTYVSPDVPDTLSIMIGAGNPGGVVQPGNELFIDDISFSFPVGVGELNQTRVSLYPNPMKDVSTLKFENPNAKAHRLTVIDMQGRVAQSQEGITKEHVLIRRRDMSAGLYFYQLENDNGIVGVGKFVLE
jgi:hypothetical protein